MKMLNKGFIACLLSGELEVAQSLVFIASNVIFAFSQSGFFGLLGKLILADI